MEKTITNIIAEIIWVLIGSDSTELQKGLINYINIHWPLEYRNRMKIEFFSVWYPEDGERISRSYKACALARLFFHRTLEMEDALIYLDTDLIFLESPEKLWKEFQNFGTSQVVGMANNYDHYDHVSNQVPFYGKTGLSSGIALMNLTRIRHMSSKSWTREIMDIFYRYERDLVYGDQDILNIYFNKFPEEVYELSCEWNFRVGQCRKNHTRCMAATAKGAAIVHGVSGSFFFGLEQKFIALFDAWRDFQLGSSFLTLYSSALQRMKENQFLRKLSVCDGNSVDIDTILMKRMKELLAQPLK